MKTKLALMVVLIHLFSTVPVFAEMNNLKMLIPSSEDKEWQLDGDAKQAEGNQLFMLINGGATLYLQLGFKRALTVTVKNKGGQLLNLDIFEMNSPEIAQQVNREKVGEDSRKIAIGVEAYLGEYYINFHQRVYQITVSGYDSSKESIESITALAKLVSRKISAFKSEK